MEILSSCKLYDTQSMNSIAPEDFRILHCNIRSLRKNYNKLIELLSICSFEFHVICISETFLYEDESRNFPISNYVFLGENRKSRCGGVGVYIHNSLAVTELQAPTLFGAESISLKILGVGERPLYLTTIYRSPSTDTGKFLADCDLYLHTFQTKLKDHILIGDLNINILTSDKDSETYLDTMNHYNFRPLITLPTRIASTSRTCIDHIMVNFDTCKFTPGIILKDTSDHFPVFVNLKVSTHNNLKSKLFKRYYKPMWKNDIQHYFSDVNWDLCLYNETNLNLCYDKFVTITREIFDKLAPIKEYVPSKSTKNPWFNNDLKHQILKKDRFYRSYKIFPFSPNLKARYIKQRNLVTSLLKKAKFNYYEKLISQQADSRKLWNTINKACGRCSSPLNYPEKLFATNEENSNSVSGNKNIANLFNKYFTEVGPNLAKSIPYVNNINNKIDSSKYSKFNLLTVDEAIVKDIILNLNDNKSEGLDQIPTILIKACLTNILTPLTYIFNKIITTGIVPNGLKLAKVIPIYKGKGSRSSCLNYRPISILPAYSKIFEKVINLQLQLHLQSEQVITSCQYGFQRKKGACDALIEFTNQSFSALNSSKAILGIFIDFSKAFDTLNHDILLNKLATYSFSTNTIHLFKNYLTDRKQSVFINNVISDPYTITCGVPQGSILGPTLFLLYINDLVKYSYAFSTILFADDTNLFYSSNNLNEDIDNINLNLEAIGNWCHSNKLTLNIQKTNFILVKNYQNNFVLNNTIKILNKNINETNTIKFLGITIDQTLSWSEHINLIRLELRKSLGLLYQASTLFPSSILILLYNSLVNSKLVYCLEAWGNAANTHLKKLFIIQKRFLRIIYRKPPNEPTSHLFKKAKILPIHHLYTQRICLLAHAKFYSSQPPSNHQPYVTRHSLYSLPLPTLTTNCGQRQVTYQMALKWNSLPVNIRLINKVNEFKRALKLHLLDLV